MVKVPGVPSKLLSTTAPSASSSEKCRVTRQPGPIRATPTDAVISDSGIVSLFPGPADIVHTAATQFGMLRVAAHVAAVVPAAHALNVCRGRDLQTQPWHLGVCQAFDRSLLRRNPGLRHHQHEAQLVLQLRQGLT